MTSFRKWVTTIVGFLLAMVGLGWLWRRERGKRLDAEARAEAQELKSAIDVAKSARGRYIEMSENKKEAGEWFDKRIAENELELLLLHDEEPEDHDDVESIRERLAALGY